MKTLTLQLSFKCSERGENESSALAGKLSKFEVSRKNCLNNAKGRKVDSYKLLSKLPESLSVRRPLRCLIVFGLAKGKLTEKKAAAARGEVSTETKTFFLVFSNLMNWKDKQLSSTLILDSLLSAQKHEARWGKNVKDIDEHGAQKKHRKNMAICALQSTAASL